MARLSSLEALPAELQILIFCAVKDVASTRCLALCGSELHSVFRQNETHITGHVLRNQFPSAALDDIIATWESSSCQDQRWTPARLDEFFKCYRGDHEAFFSKCTLALALKLSNFHSKVQRLSIELSKQTLLAAQPTCGWTDSFLHASLPEMTRIERTFYRFEMYCNFFGQHELRQFHSGSEEQLESYWDHFAPWEHEQLACVWQYLSDGLIPIFEDLGINSLHWRMWINLNRIDRMSLESILARGLSEIYMILTSDTQTLRQDFQLYHDRQDTLDFLFRGLKRSTRYAPDVALKDLTAEQASEIILPPFFSDTCPGPERVWRWAHEDATDTTDIDFGCGLVHDASRTPLRKLGYVFWDNERLELLALMSVPWKSQYQIREWSDEVEMFLEIDDRIASERKRLGLVSPGW